MLLLNKTYGCQQICACLIQQLNLNDYLLSGTIVLECTVEWYSVTGQNVKAV